MYISCQHWPIDLSGLDTFTISSACSFPLSLGGVSSAPSPAARTARRQHLGVAGGVPMPAAIVVCAQNRSGFGTSANRSATLATSKASLCQHSSSSACGACAQAAHCACIACSIAVAVSRQASASARLAWACARRAGQAPPTALLPCHPFWSTSAAVVATTGPMSLRHGTSWQGGAPSAVFALGACLVARTLYEAPAGAL